MDCIVEEDLVSQVVIGFDDLIVKDLKKIISSKVNSVPSEQVIFVHDGVEVPCMFFTFEEKKQNKNVNRI